MNEERKSAEQLVYEKVEEALYKRRLAPGTALTEQSLCDALGVGRTPVRAALRRLADAGFVVLIANRGAFVAQAGPKQIAQLYDVRITLEMLALKNGLDNYTEEDIDYMQECIRCEEEAFHKKELKAYLDAIQNFHMHIIQKGNNPYLEKSFGQIFKQILIYLALYDRFYIGGTKKLHSISNHRGMLDAIQSKNLKKLEKYLTAQKNTTIEGFDFDGTSGANVGIALLD